MKGPNRMAMAAGAGVAAAVAACILIGSHLDSVVRGGRYANFHELQSGVTADKFP